MATPQTRIDMAGRFLEVFEESGPITFQLFSEVAENPRARQFTAPFSDVSDALAKANQSGFGVFFMVNQGDGKGRRSENVKGVRALFLDLDGSPLEPVLECSLEPHFVVESSPGRFHVYYMAEEVPLAEFTKLQRALARKFGGDESVCDLPRVMRVPGFLHQKREPFLCRVMEDLT